MGYPSNQYVMFISYRSPSIDDREYYNCKTLRGVECTLNNCLSCNYHNCSFRRAVIFAKRQTYRTIIIPPSRMLAPDALISVSDFVEYCTELEDFISRANLFIRFEIEKDSYWTLMESMLWSMKSNRLHVNDTYEISLNNEETQSRTIEIPTMESGNRKFYWRILYYLRPENRHNFAWGRYSDCFLSRCPCCGNITILSRRALKIIGEYNIKLSCVYCGEGFFSYSYKWGPKQPAKVHYSGLQGGNIEAVEPDDVITLLLDKTKMAPENYAIICSENETFSEGIPMSKLFNMAYNQVVCKKNLELRYYRNKTLVRQTIWSAD